MVRPGETGWLAPTGDTQALRQSIEEALRDDDRRKAMSATCRRIAVDEYSLDVQANAYVRLYETLIARASQHETHAAPMPNGRGVVPIKL
jgi:glycosyltransferase involved in cell wall biosynthesis